ncbi:MAG: RibD family protein [Myxococcota bacterium]
MTCQPARATIEAPSPRIERWAWLRLAALHRREALSLLVRGTYSYALRDPPVEEVERAHRAGVRTLKLGCRDTGDPGPERARQLGWTVQDAVWPGPSAWMASDPPPGRPWVVAKAAVSLDGRIATAGGQSKWITGEVARRRGRGLRRRVDGILIGSETACRDHPRLTARWGPRAHEPVRIVLDGRGRLVPARAWVSTEGGPLWMVLGPAATTEIAWSHLGASVIRAPTGVGGLDLTAVLKTLRARGIRTLLVEGGAKVHGSFFDGDFVDAVAWFIAPRVLGGQGAPGAVGGRGLDLLRGRPLQDVVVQQAGGDLVVTGWWQRRI